VSHRHALALVFAFACSSEPLRDYPVVFCTTNGAGHREQSDRTIPAFRLFFDELNPLPSAAP